MSTFDSRISSSKLRARPKIGSSTRVGFAEDTEPKTFKATSPGPSITTEDSAVRKLLALFGCMEAQDFSGVFDLSKLVTKNVMLEGAAEVDRGFSPEMLLGSLKMVRLLKEGATPHPDPEAVRRFYGEWIVELQEQFDVE